MKGSSMLIVVIVSNAIMVEAVGHAQMSSSASGATKGGMPMVATLDSVTALSDFSVLN